MHSRTNDEWTRRLKGRIPWGSSTCSKAPRVPPEEPGAIVRGLGCRVWDADGREFIDYRNGLGPVTLGYRYPAVDAGIREQLESGIVFGHPHPLEAEVAEALSEVVPCAGRVRFLKTGGEAVAACIRLARFVTGRDHVIQIGYNGWLNALAGDARVLPTQTSRGAPAGVPAALSALHHACDWNDKERVKDLFRRLDGEVAALVVASDYRDPEAGRTFYPFLRETADRHGTVLVYDEIVTGFRVALAGVQEYFGVTPDLAVFAKGMANGMPLSAYVGKAAIMDRLNELPVSSTYGGETLSLAAAKACIGVYREHGVIDHLHRLGARLTRGLDAIFRERGLGIRCAGYPPCPMFVFEGGAPAETSGRFFRAAYRSGVSLYNVSYVNYSHQESDIDETLERLRGGLRAI